MVSFSSEYFEDMFKIIDNNSSSLRSSMNIFDPSNEGIREEYMTLTDKNQILKFLSRLWTDSKK